jgi:hypothetical protein
VTYSIQFAPPSQRLRTPAQQRARAWDRLLAEYLMAHPGKAASTVTALEVALWQARPR